jgi:TMEM175 potassium channel family protein
MAQERDVHVDRLIAFSDGVVAIAITLLILPLTEIRGGPDADLRQLVVENWNALLAFALSFAVIANYWTIHHDIFRPVRRHDSRLIRLNMLWLAAIVFLPFPTALIADRVEDGFGTLYIGILLVVSVLNVVIASYLTHHPELTDGRSTAEGGHHAIQSASVIAVLAAALVISLFFPTFGVLALLLLFPAQAITAQWAARTSQAPTKP